MASVSMFDMGAAARTFQSPEQYKITIAEASQQRWVEAAGGKIRYTGGTIHELTADMHPIQREFYDFYRTPRGEFTPEGSSPDLTTHPTFSSNVRFLNFYPFNDIETISPRPLLLVSGDQASPRAFSEDAYALAGHVDLYDRTDLIPFDKIAHFFKKNLGMK
ncbi:Alpha/Beta hydrolase fold [Phytophthora cactorum]|nr:Alpha/Beta hydrolase fold [Phytophthora cactorum]